MSATVINVLTPLLGAILLGILVGGGRLFSVADARVFSRFVFLVAMPVTVFNFMRKAPPPGAEALGPVAAYLLAMVIVATLAFFVARRVGGLTMRETGAAVFATVCGNAVFLGLAIALKVPGWGPPFLMLMIFEGALVFALGTALITWPPREERSTASAISTIRKNVLDGLGRAAKNPIVLGTVGGATVAVLGITLPQPLGGALDFFGPIAPALGLFILGLYLADSLTLSHKAAAMGIWRWAGPLLVLKLIIFPALTGGFAWIFTQDPALTQTGILFTMMPPAVSAVVLASTYGQLEGPTTQFVSVGTVLGLITTLLFLVVVL